MLGPHPYQLSDHASIVLGLEKELVTELNENLFRSCGGEGLFILFGFFEKSNPLH